MVIKKKKKKQINALELKAFVKCVRRFNVQRGYLLPVDKFGFSCLVNHNHLLIHHYLNVILGDSASREEHALTADKHWKLQARLKWKILVKLTFQQSPVLDAEDPARIMFRV